MMAIAMINDKFKILARDELFQRVMTTLLVKVQMTALKCKITKENNPGIFEEKQI